MNTTTKMGLYQHYKGNYYQVLGLARHSETAEILVVYQALYRDYGLWVRPQTLFNSTVLHNNQEVPRFKFIGESLQIPEWVS